MTIAKLDTSWTKQIEELPPYKLIAFKTLSNAQEFKWQQSRLWWGYLGKYLEYSQLKQAGYLPENPLIDLHPGYQEWISRQGNLLLAELGLMIDGWQIIKNAALSEGKIFDFDSPRSLFVESCRQEAEFLLKPCLIGIESSSLTQIREFYRQSNAFYRDRLSAKEAAEWLEEFKTCGHWTYFSIYAIWQHRHKALSKSWQEYLKAYKQVTSIYCDKEFFKPYGLKASQVMWRGGKMFDAKNQSPVKLPSKL
jgi:hypothetical protein